MRASFLVTGLHLLPLLALMGTPAHAQTPPAPPANPTTQHNTSTTTTTKPGTTKAGTTKPGTTKPGTTKAGTAKAAPAKTAAAPVIQPHGATHAQKPTAKAAAKPTPPPVVAAPAPAPAPAVPEEPTKGSATGNPLPRFASLRTDEVNLRRGPGTRYPIDWLYKRRDLPVEIEREFEVWRLIVDSDGVKGWVHQATLTGRRSFIVTGGEQVLRHDASETSAPVARLKPGVIGHIRSCDAGADWCQMQVGDYRGYLRRDAFWGALPNEAISN
jgi:SH3-like domain-containing protein